MTALKVDDLVPDMVLASDAVCLNGRVLLRAGTTLTENHLRIFRMWGIPDVDIADAESYRTQNERSEPVDSEISERIRSELGERFSHADMNDPLTVELFQWCLDDAIERAQS